MKAHSADLATLFEAVKYRYEYECLLLPLSWRRRAFHWAVARILWRNAS